MSQKQHGLYEKPISIEGVPGGNANLEVAALQLEAVMDLPPVSTRAGLYVFLNSLVGLAIFVKLNTDRTLACCSSADR